MLRVVLGPPCAGKSTYVNNQRCKNELVIDADAIAKALGSEASHATQGLIWTATLKARKTLIEFAIKNQDNCWLIDSSPTEQALDTYKGEGAELILIDPGIDECLKRAENRPEGTRDAIKRWYEKTGDYLKKFGVAAVKTADGTGIATPYKSVAGKGSNMQRSEISNIFPEATKEQVEAIMALHGSSTTELRGQLETANAELETLRNAPDRAAELETANSTIQSLQAELDGLKKADGVRQMRDKVAAAKKVPASLLTGETEEACTAQAEAILAFANPGYPAVQDGGEATGSKGLSTREQFESWVKDSKL